MVSDLIAYLRSDLFLEHAYNWEGFLVALKRTYGMIRHLCREEAWRQRRQSQGRKE